MTSLARTLSISGAVLLVLTLLVFALLVPAESPGYAYSLSSLLVAEALTFGGLAIQDKVLPGHDGLFVRSGWNSVIVICGIALVSVSVMSVIMGSERIAPMLAIQLCILAFEAIACLLVLHFGRRAYLDENALKAAQGISQDRYRDLRRIAYSSRDHNVRKELIRLSEDVRFSDDTKALPIDTQIDSTIVRLESAQTDDDGIAVKEEIGRLGDLLTARKDLVASSNRGGF